MSGGPGSAGAPLPLPQPAASVERRQDRDPSHTVTIVPKRRAKRQQRRFLLRSHTGSRHLAMGIQYEQPSRRLAGNARPHGPQDARGAGPLHGYGIARRIEQTSGDLLALNYGTLYPALVKLEQEGDIAGEWGVSENSRRAKFYQLTRAGKKQVERAEREWKQATEILARFLAPRPRCARETASAPRRLLASHGRRRRGRARAERRAREPLAARHRRARATRHDARGGAARRRC